MPSPQMGVQLVVKLGALVQLKPGSRVQLARQPTLVALVLPESHSSLAARSSLALPHILVQEELAVPVQMKPSSTWQAEEQPSPLAVFRSSQPVALVSLPIRVPSPQSAPHWDLVPTTGQANKLSTLQVEEQPSPFTLFPSSQFPVED